MNRIKFEVKSRNASHMLETVHIQSKNPGRNMTLYLDKETGDVLYPIAIEPVIPGITIMLDSEAVASCMFPPSVPESMISNVISYLEEFHDVVDAAREIIRAEQQRLKTE